MAYSYTAQANNAASASGTTLTVNFTVSPGCHPEPVNVTISPGA